MESNLILGLSGYYHDCSYCLVNEEGQILIHCELERDARIKEIPGNPILYYIDDVHTEKYDKRITGLSTFLHQDSMGLFETISRINSSVCEFARENGWEKIESGIPNEIKEQVKNVLKPIGEHANMCISVLGRRWHSCQNRYGRCLMLIPTKISPWWKPRRPWQHWAG